METYQDLLVHFGELFPSIDDAVNSDTFTLSNYDSSKDTNTHFVTSTLTPSNEVVLKRRERVRISEEKRRARIEVLLKDLELLVDKDSTTISKKRKLTKEELLRQTVFLLKSYMNKTQEREFRKNHDLQTLPLDSLKRQRSFGIFEVPISKDEEFVAFKVIFQKTSSYGQIWNKNKFLEVTKQLNDLASSIGRVELKFCVSWIYSIYFGFINLQLSELETINNMSRQYHEEMVSLNRKPLISNFMDSELYLNIDRSMLLAFRGKWKDAIDTFRNARDLAHRLNDVNNLCYYYCSIGCFYYAIGEKIPYNELMECFQHFKNGRQDIDDYNNFLLDYQIALAQLEIETDTSLKYEALDRLIISINGVSRFYGEAKLILSALVIYGHLIAGSISTGIELANESLNRSIEIGIYGAFGRTEILRLKAELLMVQHSKDTNSISGCTYQEILLLLQSSISNSKSSQSNTIYLKSSISYAKFVLQFSELNGKPNTLEIDKTIQVLNDAMKKVQLFTHSTLYKDANLMMEKLISLQEISLSSLSCF